MKAFVQLEGVFVHNNPTLFLSQVSVNQIPMFLKLFCIFFLAHLPIRGAAKQDIFGKVPGILHRAWDNRSQPTEKAYAV